MLDAYQEFEIGHTKRAKGRPFDSYEVIHSHNTAEIILAEKGNSISICAGETISLTAPFLIHYPAGVVHEQINSPSEEYSRYCFPISPSYLREQNVLIPHGFFAFELSENEFARLDESARLLYKYFGIDNRLHNQEPDMSFSYLSSEDIPENKRDELGKLRLSHILSLFLIELEPITAAHSKTPPLPKKVEYIRELCSYLVDNAEKKLTIDSIAEKFFVSRTKLTTDFRRVMNMSFSEYISMIRISRAKSILINSDAPAAQIAEECGFCSASHLTAAFHRLCGCTPAEFRENHKRGQAF